MSPLLDLSLSTQFIVIILPYPPNNYKHAADNIDNRPKTKTAETIKISTVDRSILSIGLAAPHEAASYGIEFRIGRGFIDAAEKVRFS